MSERKVLNKYYPPDFDPAKIPRMKLAKNRQYTVRLMAPFNMRCVTCGEYIYKGKKFNARKEDVEDQTYLGIRIYRFYIKCTRCLQEISFKTDPQNTDYEIEAGATRNFMALKLAEEQAQRELDELKEEEANNPMKLLENRTQQSRNEIELLESLEELRDLNRRQQTVDYDQMLLQFNPTETEEERERRLQLADEEYIKTVKFGVASTAAAGSAGLKRGMASEGEELVDESLQLGKYGDADDASIANNEEVLPAKRPTFADVRREQETKPATTPTANKATTAAATKQISVGGFNKSKPLMSNLVQKKEPTPATSTKANPAAPASGGGALSLLSGYSDSDESSDNS